MLIIENIIPLRRSMIPSMVSESCPNEIRDSNKEVMSLESVVKMFYRTKGVLCLRALENELSLN